MLFSLKDSRQQNKSAVLHRQAAALAQYRAQRADGSISPADNDRLTAYERNVVLVVNTAKNNDSAWRNVGFGS